MRAAVLLAASLAVACDPSAADRLAEAVRAERAGDDEAAARAWAALTEASPDRADAWRGLARTSLRTGDHTEAQRAAERAAELEPDHADTQELLGHARSRDDDPEGAAAAFARALELDPGRARLRFALGRAYEAAALPVESRDAYLAAAEADYLPARTLTAAVRVDLATQDVHGPGELETLRERLDRAEAAAGDDAAVRGAIEGLRWRIERRRRLDTARARQILRDLREPSGAPTPEADPGFDPAWTEEVIEPGAVTGSAEETGVRTSLRELGQDVTLQAVEVDSEMSPVAANRAAQGYLSRVRSCYARSLLDDRALAGELEVTLELASDGRVTSAAPDAELGGVGPCVAQSARLWRWPSAPGASTVVLRYGFGEADPIQ